MRDGAPERTSPPRAEAPRPPRSGRRRPTTRATVLGASLLALVGCGLVLIPTYKDLLNPDGVSYIAAAEHLAEGRALASVNPYWSPAFSWLLAPLLAVGCDALVAARIVSLLATWWLVAASWSLGRRLGLGTQASVSLALVACAIGVSASMTLVTPDLLVAATVITYLAHETRPRHRAWVARGAVAGALIGVGYLVKLYLLPALLLHFVCVHLAQLRPTSGHRGATLRRLGLGLGAAAAVVLPWAGVLTLKGGHFTLGTAGAYNLALKAPGVHAQPVRTGGLKAPPRSDGYSAWDDPGSLAPTAVGWSPLSPEGLRHLSTVAASNARRLWWIAAEWSVAGLGLVMVGAFLFAGHCLRRRRRAFDVAAFAMVSFPAGYLLTYVEPRFLYPLQVLAFALSAVVAQAALRAVTGRDGWRLLAVMLTLAGSFMANPLRALSDRAQEARAASELRATAEAAQQLVPSGTRVASDGSWDVSARMSFFAKWSYVGALAPDATREAWEEQLQRFEPDVLLVWEATTADLLGGMLEPVHVSHRPGLYRVRVSGPGHR